MSQDVDALRSGILGRDPGDREAAREREERERERERERPGLDRVNVKGCFSPYARALFANVRFVPEKKKIRLRFVIHAGFIFYLPQNGNNSEQSRLYDANYGDV